MATMTVNGTLLRWSPASFSYEDACKAARVGPEHNPSITYRERGPRLGDAQEGILSRGQSITLASEGDYIVRVVVTGHA